MLLLVLPVVRKVESQSLPLVRKVESQSCPLVAKVFVVVEIVVDPWPALELVVAVKALMLVLAQLA